MWAHVGAGLASIVREGEAGFYSGATALKARQHLLRVPIVVGVQQDTSKAGTTEIGDARLRG